jgi:hypothetical protein
MSCTIIFLESGALIIVSAKSTKLSLRLCVLLGEKRSSVGCAPAYDTRMARTAFYAIAPACVCAAPYGNIRGAR